MHEGTGLVFIASEGSDELRVFDADARQFLRAPAVLFPLSVPTVPRPTALGAGARYVFVLSGIGAEVGFVDASLPEGAIGPLGIDGADGFPLTQPLSSTPTALAAVRAAHELAPGLEDLALVAGIAGDGGELVAVLPPHPDEQGVLSSPSIAARLPLDGYPVALALDPPGRGAAGLVDGAGRPLADCRTVAIADIEDDPASGAEPQVRFATLRIEPDGSFELGPSPLAPITVRVPTVSPAGVVGERAAPVRGLAFAPAPGAGDVDRALAADPCALRSGRLFAVLDGAACAGEASCADLVAIDLPSGTYAEDPYFGGPAIYDLPGAALDALALAGPLVPPGGYDPATDTGTGRVGSLLLVTSSDGGIYYLDGGFGTPLVGPSHADRGPTDGTSLVDAEASGPSAGEVVRLDTTATDAAEAVPTVDVPEGAAPRDETWYAGYETPLPGLEQVGVLGGVVFAEGEGVLALPSSDERSFQAPIEVLAAGGGLGGDRLVPLPEGVDCPGYEIVAVAGDGRSITVADAPQPEPCLEPENPLAVLPPAARPWVLFGTVSGFAGRLAGPDGAGDGRALVYGGDQLLFAFTPRAAVERVLERGASYSFGTSDGLTLYASYPGSFAQLPTAIAARLTDVAAALVAPRYQVFVTYSGADTMVELDPELPNAADIFQYF